MYAFYFFTFVGICIALYDSLKKVRQEKTTKNKVSVVVTLVLFLFGIYMMADVFMWQ